MRQGFAFQFKSVTLTAIQTSAIFLLVPVQSATLIILPPPGEDAKSHKAVDQVVHPVILSRESAQSAGATILSMRQDCAGLNCNAIIVKRVHATWLLGPALCVTILLHQTLQESAPAPAGENLQEHKRAAQIVH